MNYQENNMKQRPYTNNNYVSSPNVSSSSSDSITTPKPITPILSINNKLDISCYMLSKGYFLQNKIAKTLQGGIYGGISLNRGNFNNEIVVKITNKQLHLSRMTLLNGNKIQIEENIISEMQILKYLTINGINCNLNKYITPYIDFFDDNLNFYLIMKNGGTSLFDFVLKAHNCIIQNKLSHFEWQNVSKILFKQMITFLNILHNKMNVCHLDISLENILINDVLINVDNNTQN
eukprot:498346_1